MGVAASQTMAAPILLLLAIENSLGPEAGIVMAMVAGTEERMTERGVGVGVGVEVEIVAVIEKEGEGVLARAGEVMVGKRVDPGRKIKVAMRVRRTQSGNQVKTRRRVMLARARKHPHGLRLCRPQGRIGVRRRRNDHVSAVWVAVCLNGIACT